MIKHSLKLAALTLAFAANAVFAAPIDLGGADKYTLLATGTPWTSQGGGALILGSEAEITGNIGARDYIGLAAGVKIHGDLDGGAVSAAPSAVVDGAKSILNAAYWNSLYNDLQVASNTAKALTGGTSFGSILNSTVFNATGALSVFNINGDLSLASGKSLVLKGSATDKFVVNISQNLLLGSGASILLDGVHADNVLFNMTGGNFVHAATIGAAKFSGTFIAPNVYWAIGDGTTMEATRVLASGISGNVQKVTGITKPPVVNVPEPSALLLLAFGLMGLVLRRRV